MILYRLPTGIGMIGLLAWIALANVVQGEEPAKANTTREPQALPPLESLHKARVGGKYEMLLRQIKVPADHEKYADFRDLGQRQVKSYAGIVDLPPGYWVYVYPYWYIWRDLSETPKPKRAWGPEQATGPPDTPGAGDIQTAWASLTPDGQDEWLMLEYAEPVVPSAVLVHETYNPGALVRVTAFKLDGEEVEVWKGKDPTRVGEPRGVSEIKFRTNFKTNRVRIYLDSRAVAGWNEIDAVGLRDSSGKTHWATSAHASSTYAEQAGLGGGGGIIFIGGGPAPAMPVPLQPPPPPVAVVPVPAVPVKPAPRAMPLAPPAVKRDPKDERIKELEKEVTELKDMIKRLEERLKNRDDKR